MRDTETKSFLKYMKLRLTPEELKEIEDIVTAEALGLQDAVAGPVHQNMTLDEFEYVLSTWAETDDPEADVEAITKVVLESRKINKEGE